MNLTEEQLSVINSPGNRIKIKSVAGSGKTTTLYEYAKVNFDKSILVIMFNKDLRINTKEKMPVNCEVHTANSLAYKYSKYKNRFIIDNYNVFDVMSIMNIKDINFGFLILNQYNAFVNSSLEKIDNPGYDFYKKIKTNNVKVDHGFILKEFSLSKELTDLKYDIIMVDEAQDINPVMINLIKKINHSKEIFVGDTNQAIYGFRGASASLLNEIEVDYEYTLSKTFRFGPEIAEKVNEISLSLYGSNGFIEIQGNEQIESRIVPELNLGFYSAFITRTNAELFEKAIEYSLMQYNISIPFDWEETSGILKDIMYLKLGMKTKIKNNLIANIPSFDILQEYIKNGNFKEINYLVKLVEVHNIAIFEYISLLENNLSSQKYADIIFMTAHKSKGLEFLNVEVGSDFNKNSFEEKNLIYVAATRAVKELTIKV